MSKYTDQQYLKTDQYKDASNLDARVVLHERFSTNKYGWFTWVFDTLEKLPANAKVLELGCGHGLLWKSNADRIPSTWDITLSDLSSGMLDSAWRNLVVTGRNYNFREIDAQNIPFEDETFDAVIANHMLYHVPDRAKALSEIKRVLKTSGRLIAATNGERHIKEITDWFQQVHLDNIWQRFITLFTLENGLEQLQDVFPNVTLSRYEDSLEVTQVEPIIAFIRSSLPNAELLKDDLMKIKANLEIELKEHGKIFIQKDSGMFEATK